MATGASNGSIRIFITHTRFQLAGWLLKGLLNGLTHRKASQARRKVVGRNVAEMMTPPQMGFPSLMKFTPLMRSETTSKVKSPGYG